MKKYYSGFQMILILVLVMATVYSFVEYINEDAFNSKLELVEVRVKEKQCGPSTGIIKRRRKNDKSILISYHSKDYWVNHYRRKECEQIQGTIKVYYSPEEDRFYRKLTSNKWKTCFFAILALVSLTPFKLLDSKMAKKSKKKKK